MILNQEPDMEVVGEAGNGQDALRMVEDLKADIAVLDIAMPGMNGVEVTRLLRQNSPQCRVLVLSMHRDAVYVRETLRTGASGYILKDSIDQDLLTAVRAVAAGQSFLSP